MRQLTAEWPVIKPAQNKYKHGYIKTHTNHQERKSRHKD